ncbi:hypothetical protein GCK72_006810 [Caenorhabditis remanei]|uniref:Uncharacterized protein n=1 Tax=Caenorhabditis remanei TaxID=31234 RepID=A0A6A5HLW8_CAERE|nr:hypothetical protein GCK72_006810 [Caenorhabditis remanei]KAF1766852.1 hypothetical protein GCK72_006810 [Caenorhabditis remanei]
MDSSYPSLPDNASQFVWNEEFGFTDDQLRSSNVWMGSGTAESTVTQGNQEQSSEEMKVKRARTGEDGNGPNNSSLDFETLKEIMTRSFDIQADTLITPRKRTRGPGRAKMSEEDKQMDTDKKEVRKVLNDILNVVSSESAPETFLHKYNRIMKRRTRASRPPKTLQISQEAPEEPEIVNCYQDGHNYWQHFVPKTTEELLHGFNFNQFVLSLPPARLPSDPALEATMYESRRNMVSAEQMISFPAPNTRAELLATIGKIVNYVTYYHAITMDDPQNSGQDSTVPQESTSLPVNNEFKEPVRKKRKYEKKLKSVVPEVEDSQKVLQPQTPLSLSQMVYEDAIRDPSFVLFRDKMWLNHRLNNLNHRLENYIRNTKSRTSQPSEAPPSSSNPPLRPLPNLPYQGPKNLPPLIQVKNLQVTVPLSQLLKFPTTSVPSTAQTTPRFSSALWADSRSENESPTI